MPHLNAPEPDRPCLTIVKLQSEGRLQRGDLMDSRRLGRVTVASIDSINTLTVKAITGKYYRISGLMIGANTRVVTSAPG